MVQSRQGATLRLMLENLFTLGGSHERGFPPDIALRDSLRHSQWHYAFYGERRRCETNTTGRKEGFLWCLPLVACYLPQRMPTRPTIRRGYSPAYLTFIIA